MDEHHVAKPVFFAQNELEPFSESRLSKVLISIAEAAALCREQNIGFMVAFIPEKYRVYHDLNNVTFGSEATRSWRVSNLPVELARRLTATGSRHSLRGSDTSAQDGVPQGDCHVFV